MPDARRILVVAEAGVNHNGSLRAARELVDAAAAAGADAVKFQSFRTELLVTRDAPKARYQKRNSAGGKTQFAMLKKLELSEQDQRKLSAHARRRGITFISTPFDPLSLDFLARELRVPMIKLGSGELTNAPLLLRAARFRRPLIVSTGMATLADVREALGVIAFGMTRGNASAGRAAFRAAYRSKSGQAALRRHVTLLQCTTEYPAPDEELNLLAMDSLRKTFGLRVGFSDHSLGIAVAVAAAARGAEVIEKHFTLDRRLPGPDHRASLEPDELKEMVRAVRQVRVAMGDGVKRPGRRESANIAVARKSLAALAPIRRGERFSALNLGAMRPGNGISPMRYWEWLGRKATRNYAAGELIRR